MLEESGLSSKYWEYAIEDADYVKKSAAPLSTVMPVSYTHLTLPTILLV